MSDQCWIGDTNSIELGMDDNIPYYDGLVGTLQLKRCTMYHLRYTMYHKTNALAAACPCDATGEYHSVPGAGGEVVRSCVARFCIRAHASHPITTTTFPAKRVPRGEGGRVSKGATSHTSHILINYSFPPFSLLSPLQLIDVKIPIHSNLLSFDTNQTTTPTAYPGTPKKRHV